MSMEQRVTALEEISRLVVAALQESNAAMQRYNEAMRRTEESMRRYEGAAVRRDDAIRESAVALECLDAAVQELLAFVPVTQAEIVRLGNRIDQLDRA